MNNSKSQIDKYTTELELSSNDLTRINKPRQKYYRNLVISELFIGISSFIAGFLLAPPTENVGYPFLPIIFSPNISSSDKLRRTKPYIPIMILTLLIIFLGMISGYSVGFTAKTTTTIAPIRYSVHSNHLTDKQMLELVIC
ncbi:MAG: hypothetical protein ACXAC2_17505, partial [Candidatus Kariarchaeaceae archaeon]